jgi:hypothetical protein
LLAGTLEFKRADAGRANHHAFVGSVRELHVATLQVGFLEMTVMFVRKTDFIGFIAATVTHFTTRHEKKSSLYNAGI